MKFPRSLRRGGVSLVVAVSLVIAAVPGRAQRPASKPAPAKTAPTPQTNAGVAAAAATDEHSPSVTFDTLLSADAYGVYAELRAVGRYANSEEVSQLLAPVRLGNMTAPSEVLALFEFLRLHADELMTARLMFATMPVRAGLPETLLAVEMPSVEAARKFVPELRQFVAANLTPSAPPDSDLILTTGTTTAVTTAAHDSNNARRGARRRARAAQAATASTGEAARAKRPVAPPFQIKRAGNLIALSNEKFTFKDVHGTGEALLVNEPGFQVARTRFTTDTLFVYLNTLRMSNSSRQRQEALEKEYQRQQELAQAEARKRGAEDKSDEMTREEFLATLNADGNMNVRADANGNSSAVLSGNTNSTNANVVAATGDGTSPTPSPTPEATPPPKSEKELEAERERERSQEFVRQLASLVFERQGGSREMWPESIGLGASLDADAVVLRGLFINSSPDEPLRPIPFLPVLLSGPSIPAETASVLPADADIFLSLSLDLPQMYDYLASMLKIADLAGAREEGKPGFADQLAAFEKTNNFRIREELLAALGNEIGVAMPGDGFFGGGAKRARQQQQQSADDSSAPPELVPSGPIVVIALNDKESLQKLLPRVLNSVGFAGATEQSVIEKRGQAEVLTFSNGTLAFIDRFLVGSPDPVTMQHVVDSYNRGETLASGERFREATSWQAKQGVGQVYVANELLKGIFEDVTKSVEDIDDPAARAYLSQINPNPGAITLHSTRDADGLMHELRLPKNLLTLFTASELVNQKLSVMRSNEYSARWKLHMIYNAQSQYKTSKGRYGTLEELKAAGSLGDQYTSMETPGYEIKLSASGDRFEATATPTGYPKLGRRSFYIDHTGPLRGADTGGKPATESTPIIE